MNRELILVQNNQVELPSANPGEQDMNTRARVATVLSNMAYYGYTVNRDVYEGLMQLSDKNVNKFWATIEPELKEITGANRRMDDFVVYKNFPSEVLNMSDAEYWLNQICMYIGFPNEYFTEEVVDRPKMVDLTVLRTLSLANENAYSNLFETLKNQPVRWNDTQLATMKYLVNDLSVTKVDVTEYGFKENAIRMIDLLLRNNTQGLQYVIPDATDVLRLAAAMSDGDHTLRTRVVFRNFTRAERKLLLGQLELSKNLEADVAARSEVWKRLIKKLHPGDYKFNLVKEVANRLYKGEIKTFNSKIEAAINGKDQEVLALLQARPGEFVRRLHKMYDLFGADAINAFKKVVPSLETMQLLKLTGYVATINERKTLMYPPKGNWTAAVVEENKKTQFSIDDQLSLMSLLNNELKSRMSTQFPNGVELDYRLSDVKLQTNDQKLASYGRGTTFDIPESMTFIRTASYWKKSGSNYNTWFDNGWNFFDSEWKPVGTVCWDSPNMDNASIFSGDPTNSKDMEGRACQMIDLYLAQLEQMGVKYAVWNVLAYSHICFDEADEVLATLQWGENAETGNLYEPARAQMVFPLKGQNMTKYIAYIDVPERKLVYMDANLRGSVHSATNNVELLSKNMPAFLEYLKSLPSVADMFVATDVGETKILYSDEDIKLSDKEKAYVFKPVNPDNSFDPISVMDLML